MNWENDGKEIRDNIIRKYPYLKGNPDFVAKNPSKYFLPGVTWGKITSGVFSSRFTPEGSIFSDAGMKAFPIESGASPLPILGLLNSKIAPFFLSAFSETMNFEQGDIARIPFASVSTDHLETIVGISKSDWDSYETSWDFTTLPLLSPDHRSGTLEATYAHLRAHWAGMTAEMQRLEEENNLRPVQLHRPRGMLLAPDSTTALAGQVTQAFGLPLPPNASPSVHSGGVQRAAIRAGKTMTRRKVVHTGNPKSFRGRYSGLPSW